MIRARSRSPHLQSYQGFTLICKDGQIGVSNEEEILLRRASPYFDALFKHGTAESSTRSVTKRDWTVAVSKNVLKILCNVTAAIELASLPDLCRALDEIVCLDDDVIVCPTPPLYGYTGLHCEDVVPASEYIRFPDLHAISSRWQLTPNRGVGVIRLLEHGIKLTSLEGLAYVARRQELGNSTCRRFPFIVEASRKSLLESIQCYFELRQADGRLAACLKNKTRFHRSELSVCISGLLFPQKPEKVVKSIAGQLQMRGYCQYEKDGQGRLVDPRNQYHMSCSEGSTHVIFLGSLSQLCDAIKCLERNAIYTGTPRLCSLRIAAPSKQQFISLAYALELLRARSHKRAETCIDDIHSVGVLGNARTVGFDFGINAVYTIKPLDEMHELLEHMARTTELKEIGSKNLKGFFHVYELETL